jgi:GntR family transcriptional repressor for pyruvate dehydrogenase complex
MLPRMSSEALERRPVYVQVADHMREAILTGALAAGSALPSERELCERFGVGRTTVREALRALQVQGLAVAAGPTAPLHVVAPDALSTDPLRDTLVHLYRLGRVPLADLVGLRRALEAAGAADAAAREPRSDLAPARAEIACMRAAGDDREAFEQADVRFHLEIVRASGNEALTLMMLAVRDSIAAHLRTSLSELDDPAQTLARLIAEHEEILDAVARGDAGAARQLSDDHIVRFYQEST